MRNDGVGAVGGLPLAVYSGRIALVLFGGWRAVRLLPRRLLIEALTEMAEQFALNGGVRHHVMGAA
jgi:hypothetical protein